MDVLDMVRRMAFRNIQSSKWVTGNPFQISVQFENGSTVTFKDNVGLRMWAAMIQHLCYEPIEGNTDHCTRSPLYYFSLLGFRAGDAILFRNESGVEEPILFS